MILSEAKVGDRVSFIYYGGSNPGTRRTVDVKEVGVDRIYGVDVNKEKERQFLFSESAIVRLEPAMPETVADIQVEERPTKVNTHSESFVSARSRIIDMIDSLNGEDLAELVSQIDGDGDSESTFDEMTGQITTTTKEYISYFRSSADGVDIVNKEGKVMSMVLLVDGGIAIDNMSFSPDHLAVELSRHLGLTQE